MVLTFFNEMIGDLHVNIHSGEFGAEGGMAKATLVVEVSDLDVLQKVLKAVEKIPAVEHIDRYQVG